MAATYRKTNGSWDRHQAFIVLGPDEETGALVSRAYTDGGKIHEFHLVMEDGRLMFPDRMPHNMPAVAARKVLAPTAQGYESALKSTGDVGSTNPITVCPFRENDHITREPGENQLMNKTLDSFSWVVF